MTSKTLRSWLDRTVLVPVASLLLLALIYGLMKEYSSVNRHFRQPYDYSQFVKKFAASDDEKTLHIHIVPHTHDDVGWRKTVEQYYYGWNNSIDTRGHVDHIIGGSLEALRSSEHRTFTFVETKFLSMWWNEQTNEVQDQLRWLIANDQWVFVNGGWCMHDEASTHYMGMLDQTTLGHEFLHDHLGVHPRIGWQLDPFGHSSTQANLLAKDFNAIYFGRIDYQDRTLRQLTRQCEGLWNASVNDDTTLFWGLTGQYGGNYGCPEGFCFDYLCSDEPLVGAKEARLRQRMHTFLELMRIEADQTQGNHIMVTMGGDFTYQDAEKFYSNIDLLIGLVMSYQHWEIFDIPGMFGPRYDRVNIFYSNPEYYTDMKYKEASRARTTSSDDNADTSIGDPNWQVKTDDFFPYSDCPHCFWTGYFTSRTAFKRFERVSSSFLLAARQIHTVWGNCTCCNPLYSLEDALGVAQHHDAVSGTAKQHVADDYSKRLQAGLDIAASYVAGVLKDTLTVSENSVLDNLAFCGLLNETSCEISEQATLDQGTDVYVVVYNAKTTGRTKIVRLPVGSNATYSVERLSAAPGRRTPVLEATPVLSTPVDPRNDEHKLVILFDSGSIPPMGTVVFRVSMTSPVDNELRNIQQKDHILADDRMLKADDDIIAKTDHLTAAFDRDTGSLKRVTSHGVDLNVSQIWGYYTSFDRDIDYTEVPHDQNSGAYIFRPSIPEQELIHVDPSSATFVNTSVGLEVHMSFKEPWIRQVTRVFSGQPFVEIEYTIGPVPIDDGRGREVVTRFLAPSIDNEATFYTDSNGREFLERKRNYRPTWDMDVYEPVAGNYYPVNAGIYIQDDAAAMTILTDRSQGGSSIVDGSMELMVQRRTVADDYRGVDEPLNETTGGMSPYPPYGNAERIGDGVIIRGTHRLFVGQSGATLARAGMDDAFVEPVIFVSSAPQNQTIDNPSMSALSQTIPSNVMILALKPVSGDSNTTRTWLIRLGHQYSVGDHKVLSQPATIHMDHLFADWSVIEVVERSLTGTQDAADVKRMDWSGSGQSEIADDSTTIVLKPMDIRTFHITVTRKSSRTSN